MSVHFNKTASQTFTLNFTPPSHPFVSSLKAPAEEPISTDKP